MLGIGLGLTTVRRSGGPWTPASLPNLLAWYDASDAATVTHSSGAVSQWNDKSGNGYHVAQSNASYKPTYSATGLDGTRAGIAFNDDMLYNASLVVPAGTLVQAMIVFKPTSGSINFDRVVSLWQAASDANGYIPILRNDGSAAWCAYGGGVLGTVALANGNVAVLDSIVSGTQHTMYLNGVAGTPVAYTYSGTFAPTKVGLGAPANLTTGDATSVLVGVLAEVILTKGAISAANLAASQAYRAAKWGL